MKIERRLGPGDRQHVRASLFSVFLVSSPYMDGQVEACMVAANKLGMMARCYMNWEGLDADMQRRVTSLVHQNPNHQIMELGDCTKSEFDFIICAADLVVYDEFPGIVRMGQELLDVWEQSGGRFTEGNHQQYTLNELWALYPECVFSNDEAYKLYMT